MPLLVKHGDMTLGHGYPPVPAIGRNAFGEVFVEGVPAVSTGDTFGFHTLAPETHMVVAGVGSPDVFIKNIPVWRSGDPTTCGDTGNSPNGTVYANGN